MRIDKNNPRQTYNDFWDWLHYDKNVFWLLALPFGYLYYLTTTYEAKP